jgi:hypothetical protein
MRTRRGGFAFLRVGYPHFGCNRALRSGHPIGVLANFTNRPRLSMSTDSGQDDLPKILARAFLHAWKQYCEADLNGKHCEEVARPFLKGVLVEFAKEGVTDEEQLVAAGLRYLISLTRKPAPSKRSMKDEEKTTQDGRWPVHFCINRAPAKFLLQWHASKRWAPLPGPT